MRRLDQPATLWMGLFFFASAFFFFYRIDIPHKSIENIKDRLSKNAEFIALAAIFSAALFFRVYRIAEFPGGVEEDRAASALGSLRILYENWRPGIQETYAAQLSDLSIYYLLAAWFKLFGSSAAVFAYFDVFISLAALPFIYWTFRQLSGPKSALTALAFLSFMRWHFSLGRGVNVHIEEMLLWMFAALAFWLYAFQKKAPWAFMATALLAAIGTYGYAGFKGFLLILGIFFVYESSKQAGFLKKNSVFLWGALLLFLLAVVPILDFVIQHQSLGRREGEASILWQMRKAQSLSPLLKSFAQGALMFNREGSPSAQFNYGRVPMLDDVTGLLFVLGLGLALRRMGEKGSFYGVVGLGGMLLPAVLSNWGCHPGRALGASPFAALLAAKGFDFLCSYLKPVLVRSPIKTWMVGGAVILSAAAANFDAYFLHQAQDPDCQGDFCPMETFIGKKIQELGQDNDIFLSSWFAGRYTIRYLSFSQRRSVKNLDWPQDLGPFSTPRSRGRLFVLDDTEGGQWAFLQKIYPEGRGGLTAVPTAKTPYYSFFIPPKSLDEARGLKKTGSGQYAGSYFADQPGDFHFRWKDNRMRLMVGNARVLRGKGVHLAKGFHPIRMSGASSPALSLEVLDPSGKEEPLNETNTASFKISNGLLGLYYHSLDEKEKPILEEWDPLIDFHAFDFPASVPYLYAHWKGRFFAGKAGHYEWTAYTYPDERARMRVDGSYLTLSMESPSASILLARGWHSLELEYQKSPGLFSAMVLLWEKPGANNFEIMPNDAFGSQP